MPDREVPGHKVIKCPYCDYPIDLTVTKPHPNCAGVLFISCPNPETYSSFSFKDKPFCGQCIRFDDELNVIPD